MFYSFLIIYSFIHFLKNSRLFFIRVFTATWNVAGKSPSSDLNLDNLLQIHRESDIYVLGCVLLKVGLEILPFSIILFLISVLRYQFSGNSPFECWKCVGHRR